MNRRAFLAAAGGAFALSACAQHSKSASARSPALEVGALLFLRHAITDDFDESAGEVVLGDCETQRNLSGEGAAQARLLGKFVRDAGLRPHEVISSPYCRCQDTARLAFAKPVGLDTDLLPLTGLDEEAIAARVAALGAMAKRAREKGAMMAAIGHSDLPVAAGFPKPEEGGGLLLWAGEDGLELLGMLRPSPYRLEAVDSG